jgi:hypothetical protein
MTPYYRTKAYREAIRQPYHVSTYAGWTMADPTAVVGFPTEAEARDFARSRPEPLIDMVRRDCGIQAARRMAAHPSLPVGVTPRLFDDFQP